MSDHRPDELTRLRQRILDRQERADLEREGLRRMTKFTQEAIAAPDCAGDAWNRYMREPTEYSGSDPGAELLSLLVAELEKRYLEERLAIRELVEAAAGQA